MRMNIWSNVFNRCTISLIPMGVMIPLSVRYVTNHIYKANKHFSKDNLPARESIVQISCEVQTIARCTYDKYTHSRHERATRVANNVTDLAWYLVCVERELFSFLFKKIDV